MEGKSHKFKYEEITDHISRAIHSGAIPYGSKLPSLRQMSQRFDCSLSVVMQAYGELESQGKTYAIEKSGYFASPPRTAPLPAMRREFYHLMSEEARPLSILGKVVEASSDRSILPLGAGIPDQSLLPLVAIKQSFNRVLRENPSLLQKYSQEAGDINLRQEICKILLSRGIELEPQEILITNGCTEALSLALQICTIPGEAIALESPVFLGVIQLIRSLGRRVIALPTSASEGMDLDALESVLKKGEVKTVVMTALYQNPLGYVMPLNNRRRAVELAEKYDGTIIEDDLYSDCSHEQKVERPLKSFDKSGRVIYCSSFSKTISPAMRMGWMAGGIKHTAIRSLKISQSLGGSPLAQSAMADFLGSLRYETHVKKLQKALASQYREMKELVCGAFPQGTAISSPQGGLYLWVELPPRTDTLALFEQALKEGISTVPGQAFCSGDRFGNCLRLSFGSPITDDTRRGIERLGELIYSME